MACRRRNTEYVMLREAIKKKDKVTARNLILNNADVNVPHARGGTPLHWAIIKYEDVEIMTMLLDRGANIHAKNNQNDKPLGVAIQNYKTEAASLLIKRGALIGEDLNALLLMAIERNNIAIVKILIDNGMKSNSPVDLKIPLNAAISYGQLEIIEHILPHCRFLNPSDKYITKELIVNYSVHYKKCVEVLLKWNFTVSPNSVHDKDYVYNAVQKGYLPIVLQLLELGIDVNLVNLSTGLNLLKVACLNKHYKIVEILLEHNACVNEMTSTNIKISNNDLYNCYDRCKYNPSVLFLQKKINASDITCLHIAVLNSDSMMTKLLLRYGATITNDTKFFNLTCLAVRSNCEDIVRTFLDRGVNVNDVDFEGNSLLHFCVFPDCNISHYNSRYKIAKMLLDRGATNHIQTPGNSLLFEAIKNGYHNTAQLFLDYKADIQYVSSDGNSLLHKAVENYFDVEFIKTLLKRNSPVNAVNNDMLTPLFVACKSLSKYQLESIKILIHYKANVNCIDKSLMTPLHFLCQAQNFQFIKVLLLSGANSNAANIIGETPLHIICKYRSCFTPRIIQLLLKHNANIEAVDKKGWTPLFVACETENDKAVKCLLDNHANVNHTDFEKLTSLYIAAKNYQKNSAIVKLLLEHKVNVHCMDKQGNSVIHLIADKKNVELVKCLTKTQANFNSVNKEGKSPLHIAVEKVSIGMTETFIKYGANVNILDKKNQTPLKTAVDYIAAYQRKLQNSEGYSDEEVWDPDTYESQTYLSKKLIKALKIQVIKLKVAGLKVNNQNLNIAYTPSNNETSNDELPTEDYPHYEDFNKRGILQLEIKCEREIEKLKMESIGVNNITFYDLLTKNIHFLCRFVKNKNIRQTLELVVYNAKFPLYIDIIRSRFRDAKFRYRLMNSAKQYFTSYITQRLPDNCIDTVFSYLNIKELKMFIRAMKPLNV